MSSTKALTKRKTRKGIKKPDTKKIRIIITAITVLAIISTIIAIACTRPTYKPSGELYKFGKHISNGIDVSEHNGKIDWDEVSKSVDFAFIRVGYRGYGNGKIVEDKYACKNLEDANEAGIPIGVYFYSQAITEHEAVREADFVYSIIKHYKIDLPVIIDFEYATDSSGKHTGRLTDADNDSQTNTEIINAFLSRIDKRGYTTGVYASSSVLAHRINAKSLNEGAMVWVADYNSKVSYKVDYTVWQYSETGTCNGIKSKYVDLNYWYE